MVDSTHHHEHLNFTRGGSLSPGASTIAASVEGSHHHQHQQTIGALAKAGYRGKFYTPQHQLQTQNEDIEKDSISNSDTTRDLNIMSRSDHHRNKKLSWQHEDFQVRFLAQFEG